MPLLRSFNDLFLTDSIKYLAPTELKHFSFLHSANLPTAFKALNYKDVY